MFNITDFVISKQTLLSCKTNESDLKIPCGIKKIGKNAFEDCKTIESVVLADSVTIIDNSAFKGCTNLKKIKNSSGLVKIVDDAFLHCGRFEGFDNTSNLMWIGKHSFKGCIALESLEFDSRASVGADAFYGCKKLAVFLS